MPHGKTKFNTSWLGKTDCNGHQLKIWCEKDSSSDFAGYCFLCKKTIRCGNTGATQILNHAQGQKHKDAIKLRESNTQMFFKVPHDKPSASQGGGDAVSGPAKQIPLLSKSQKDQVMTAEILWAMKVAKDGFTFSSCDGIPELFVAMFPGPISEKFTMSKSKISYILSDGLGPYFRTNLCKQIIESKVPYTVQFDETGNAQGNKQCDILLRFWNTNRGEIVTHFLKAAMFGHAVGEDVAEELWNSLEVEDGVRLPVNQLISIGSDGPNVNKKIWTLLNERLKSGGLKGLVDFTPCTLHVVHNAFRKGLDVFGEDVESLAVDMFQWFKSHPCQKEDFQETLDKMDLNGDTFVRHVQCRWLTLIPALERLRINWDACKQYFLRDLPQMSQKNRTSHHLKRNDRYKRICQALSSQVIYIQLLFVISCGPLFNPFLTLFQKQEPLIHLLHSESTDLLKKVMNWFVKEDLVQNASVKKLMDMDMDKKDNLLPLKDIERGESKTVLEKLGEEKHKPLLMDMQKFYTVTADYLRKKLPLTQKVVKYAQCLHPEVRDQNTAMRYVRSLAEEMPGITPNEVAMICDEWKVYRVEEIENSVMYDNDHKLKRVDHFWKEVLSRKSASGNQKFPTLQKLVYSSLCLTHGNADVERSLSINKKILTSERTLLSEQSLNALRLTRDAVEQYDGNVTAVPITKTMMKYVTDSHQKYLKRLEDEKQESSLLKKVQLEQKRQREMESEAIKKNEDRKRKISEKEKEVKKNEAGLQEDMHAANNLFKEANDRLASAIKKKDFKEIDIAHALLDVARTKIDKATNALETCRSQRNEIESKKSKLIASYSQKEKSSISGK